MNKYLLYIKSILLVFCITVAVSGCAMKEKHKIEDMKPAVLLEKGLEHAKKNETTQAITYLLMVKDRYPYTESAVVASLKLADTYYDLGENATAYDFYSEFERFHPKDENIPYIKYKKGMCFFKQIRGFDREQKYALSASVEFIKLINEYPDNEYAIKARRHHRECLLKLTKFEIYTGDFYFRTKHYLSALNRYKYAIKHYPDVGQYHNALEKISLCKLKLAELDKKELPEQ